VIVYWDWGIVVAEMEATMNRVHGWFSDNKTWIEFIIATVVLWLMMMVVIQGMS
jgi:hypothetical protein